MFPFSSIGLTLQPRENRATAIVNDAFRMEITKFERYCTNSTSFADQINDLKNI